MLYQLQARENYIRKPFELENTLYTFPGVVLANRMPRKMPRSSAALGSLRLHTFSYGGPLLKIPAVLRRDRLLFINSKGIYFISDTYEKTKCSFSKLSEPNGAINRIDGSLVYKTFQLSNGPGGEDKTKTFVVCFV